MSHFTVLVCLDKDTQLEHGKTGETSARTGLKDALDRVLERFNENREVELYRDYLDCHI